MPQRRRHSAAGAGGPDAHALAGGQPPSVVSDVRRFVPPVLQRSTGGGAAGGSSVGPAALLATARRDTVTSAAPAAQQAAASKFLYDRPAPMAMRRGDHFVTSKFAANLRVAVGWTGRRAGQRVDLDLSAICFTKDAKKVDHVSFGRRLSRDRAMYHCGDERGGGRCGASGRVSAGNVKKVHGKKRDDGEEEEEEEEVLCCNLQAVTPEVHYIVLLLSVYSSGCSFDDLSRVTTRVEDINFASQHFENRVELLHFSFAPTAARQTGAALLVLVREPALLLPARAAAAGAADGALETNGGSDPGPSIAAPPLEAMSPEHNERDFLLHLLSLQQVQVQQVQEQQVQGRDGVPRGRSDSGHSAGRSRRGGSHAVPDARRAVSPLIWTPLNTAASSATTAGAAGATVAPTEASATAAVTPAAATLAPPPPPHGPRVASAPAGRRQSRGRGDVALAAPMGGGGGGGVPLSPVSPASSALVATSGGSGGLALVQTPCCGARFRFIALGAEVAGRAHRQVTAECEALCTQLATGWLPVSRGRFREGGELADALRWVHRLAEAAARCDVRPPHGGGASAEDASARAGRRAQQNKLGAAADGGRGERANSSSSSSSSSGVGIDGDREKEGAGVRPVSVRRPPLHNDEQESNSDDNEGDEGGIEAWYRPAESPRRRPRVVRKAHEQYSVGHTAAHRRRHRSTGSGSGGRGGGAADSDDDDDDEDGDGDGDGVEWGEAEGNASRATTAVAGGLITADDLAAAIPAFDSARVVRYEPDCYNVGTAVGRLLAHFRAHRAEYELTARRRALTQAELQQSAADDGRYLVDFVDDHDGGSGGGGGAPPFPPGAAGNEASAVAVAAAARRPPPEIAELLEAQRERQTAAYFHRLMHGRFLPGSVDSGAPPQHGARGRPRPRRSGGAWSSPSSRSSRSSRSSSSVEDGRRAAPAAAAPMQRSRRHLPPSLPRRQQRPREDAARTRTRTRTRTTGGGGGGGGGRSRAAFAHRGVIVVGRGCSPGLPPAARRDSSASGEARGGTGRIGGSVRASQPPTSRKQMGRHSLLRLSGTATGPPRMLTRELQRWIAQFVSADRVRRMLSDPLRRERRRGPATSVVAAATLLSPTRPKQVWSGRSGGGGLTAFPREASPPGGGAARRTEKVVESGRPPAAAAAVAPANVDGVL